ncbi:hypothetical protein SLEP1_g14371 [Rubroshorea leprosula]|uniref:Uncharacterized protein n=1 Tax=Rubroshorea leprosula TaxID=152421 RepID=A0AAV5IN96_9ROSI|nr:hypothetical protein SLEP1_g14371 [Rubroshorea leprosula]
MLKLYPKATGIPPQFSAKIRTQGSKQLMKFKLGGAVNLPTIFQQAKPDLLEGRSRRQATGELTD